MRRGTVRGLLLHRGHVLIPSGHVEAKRQQSSPPPVQLQQLAGGQESSQPVRALETTVRIQARLPGHQHQVRHRHEGRIPREAPGPAPQMGLGRTHCLTLSFAFFHSDYV